MSLAEAISASAPAPPSQPTAAGRKTVSNNKNSERPKNDSPAFLAYEAKRNACDARINEIRARIDAARNGYSYAGGENMNEKNRKLFSELVEKVKTLRAELKVIEDEKRGLSNQFAETLEALKKKNADVSAAKEKMAFKNPAEIEAKIREIESTLESGRFTLSEERQMLQEVTKLRKMKKALENLDGSGSGAANDVNSLRIRLDQLKLRQSDAESRISEKRAQINAINAQIDELNGKRAAEQAKRADSQVVIEGLKKQLDAEYASKKAAWDEYLQVKAAKEAAYHRMVARKEEQARVSAIEDEIDQLEKQLGRLTSESVIDKKWNECTNLINFFSPLAPHVLTPEESNESNANSLSVPVKAIRKVEGFDLSKVQVIKKVDECYFVPSKHSKKHQKKSSAADSSDQSADLAKLPFHILAALADMSLPIPKSVENDLPDLLRTIQSRRNDLQEHRQASLAEIETKRNAIISQIEDLRNKIESKDEQITASVVKKAEKSEKSKEAEEEQEDQIISVENPEN